LAGQDNTYVSSDATGTTYNAFTSDTFTIQVAQGTLTVSSPPNDPPGPGFLPIPSNNNYVEQIALTASGGAVTVSSIKVQQDGTANDILEGGDPDILSVHFYLSTGADNTWEFDLGPAIYEGFPSLDKTYSSNFTDFTVPSGSTYWVLVWVDIHDNADGGDTVITQVNDGYVTASLGTVNPITPFSSETFVLGAPGGLGVSTPDNLPDPGGIGAGTNNNAVDKMTWTASADGVIVSGFTVTLQNTATMFDIWGIGVWEDNGVWGQYDPGVDVLVGTALCDNVLAIRDCVASGLSHLVPTGGPLAMLITANVVGNPFDGSILVTRVDAVTASSGSVGPFSPFLSNSFTIFVPGTLTVGSTANNPAGGNVSAGIDNNYVERIELSAATGSVTVTELKVKETGSAADISQPAGDINAVRFYLDSNADGTAESLLGGGNATYNNSDQTYTVSGLNFTVPGGSTSWVEVRADIASGATNGDNVVLARRTGTMWSWRARTTHTFPRTPPGRPTTPSPPTPSRSRRWPRGRSR
jgi:hypothetical protein